MGQHLVGNGSRWRECLSRSNKHTTVVQNLHQYTIIDSNASDPRYIALTDIKIYISYTYNILTHDGFETLHRELIFERYW